MCQLRGIHRSTDLLPSSLLGVLAGSKAQVSHAFLKILVILRKKCRWLYERGKSRVRGLQLLGQRVKKLARIAKGSGALQRAACSSPKDKPLVCFVGGGLPDWLVTKLSLKIYTCLFIEKPGKKEGFIILPIYRLHSGYAFFTCAEAWHIPLIYFTVQEAIKLR